MMRPCLKIKSINSAAAVVYVVINRCEFALWWCPGRRFVVQVIKWVTSVPCGLGLTRSSPLWKWARKRMRQ